MTDPITPSTPPSSQPPAATPTSDCSSTNSSRGNYVDALSKALAKAGKKYIELNEAALEKGNNFDDFVEVELPDKECPSIDQLGEACSIAKRNTRTTKKPEIVIGKMKLVAFSLTSQVFVRQVASGHKHREAVTKVVRYIDVAATAFSGDNPRFVRVSTDGMYGDNIISAPDVTVRSLGLPPNGQPARDSKSGPVFFAEVEDGNRSLPEQIRHLGMLLVNFPRLNGVLGIKGEDRGSGNKTIALVAIEWPRNAAGVQIGQPQVTSLIDFGPNTISDARKGNAEQMLQLPRPPLGTKAVAGTHGCGVATALPVWTRHVGGYSAPGQPFIVQIPPALLFGGAFSRTKAGVVGVVINIPQNAIPASINLPRVVEAYFDDDD